MKHVIAGTAGHIDHGKTALVRALTGIDTDRLEEEKRRGISIDLGFAHLDLTDDLRIALIDVPGHERFIKNMLAGVGGIDLVLLIIAADESIKPQTREHLDICRLLRVPSGVIVITKTDLVDYEILQLVEMEVQDFVRGTFLENAPLIPVSAVTGAGLSELRDALRMAASAVQAKSTDRIFRMPVDRAFSMTGFGAVVTGTVLSGSIRVEDEVQAYPAATSALRVRGIQVHGQSAGRAIAGQRTALNLAGNVDQLIRGVVLSEPGRFRPTTLIDCSLQLLESAGPIKNGAPVHFHAGTAEIVAEIRLLGAASTGFVRLALKEPALLLPGDRFILRKFSPLITIGGGYVIDAHPVRSNRSVALARARSLDSAPLDERIRLLVGEAPEGLAFSDLVSRTGETERALLKALPSTVMSFGDPPIWFLSRGRADSIIAAIAARLEDFHRENPLAPGISKEEVRRRHLADAPALVFDALLKGTSGLKGTPRLAVTGELLHLSTHKIALRGDEEEALARIEGAFERARLAVPGLSEVLQNSGVESIRAKSLLQILLRSKRLIRVGEELVYHPQALQELRDLLGARKGQTFSVADFKEWTGVSRKYAIPLLEFLDREKLTRRQGATRLVV